MTDHYKEASGFSHLSRRALLLAAALSPLSSRAQVQTITVLSPYAPGGSADALARMVAEWLGPQFAKNGIVENKPGAGGTTALMAVSRGPLDGSLLTIGATGAVVVNPHTNSATSNFNPLTATTPVAKLANIPFVIVASEASKIRSIKDLLERAAMEPGGISYATGGENSGQHIAMEQLKRQTKAKLTHVPYRGSAPAMLAVLAGDVPLAASDLTSAEAHLKSGKVRALAVTSAKRTELLPGVPTVAEAGLPNYAIEAWLGLFAPAQLPKPLLARMSSALEEMTNNPQIQQRMKTLACTPGYLGADDFARFLASESEQMRALLGANK